MLVSAASRGGACVLPILDPLRPALRNSLAKGHDPPQERLDASDGEQPMAAEVILNYC